MPNPVNRRALIQNLLGTLTQLATPNPDNRRALADFYEAASGDNWIRSDNWLTDAPLGDWRGVTANRDGVVTGLDAHKNNLEGKIPPETAHLTELAKLDLSGNGLIYGGAPPELGELTKLESLDLSGNYLSGGIPPELGRLTKLKYLNLRDNELAGSIPPELGGLTELKTLKLAGNHLSGAYRPN